MSGKGQASGSGNGGREVLLSKPFLCPSKQHGQSLLNIGKMTFIIRKQQIPLAV